MPEVSLKLRPGVQAELTPTLNEAGISSSNLIRFKAGLPQKLGGWIRYYQNTLSGVPRFMQAWGDLNAVDRLAVGTTNSLGVIENGVLSLITPQFLITNPTCNFTTTVGSAIVEIVDPNVTDVTLDDAIFFNTPINVGGLILRGIYQITSITGAHTYQIIAASNATSSATSGGSVPQFSTTTNSSIVSVTLINHRLSVGDVFTFPIATTGGGVTIIGTYKVQSIVNPNIFNIGVSVRASSTTGFSMNGGLAQLYYYINIGPPAAGSGYGLGGYGAGSFGTGVTPGVQIGNPIAATNWSIDNWGEILLACPKGGAIYYWPPNSGFQNAFVVETAPPFNGGIFVAMPEQILVAWGSASASPNSTGLTASAQQRDPLIVRWSDSLDFSNWTVSSLTQAGSFRIPTGSAIVGAIQGPTQALIWTDIEVWAMQYLGPPLVFGFNKLSSGCGLIGEHAIGVQRGVVYWMSQGSFFALAGSGVQELPCPVWDVVFQDLDINNLDKITCAVNSQFGEVTWYYPSISGGTGEPDKYVKVNTSEGFAWDYGTLPRSAWIDQSVLGQAIGASPQGLIYQHEMSNDADGQPLVSTFETGYFVIAEGQQFAFVDWMFPDMKWGYFNGAQTASIQVTITAVTYPNATPVIYGPFTMTQAVQYINMRLRGRQLKLSFQSNDLGSFWRLGGIRYRIAPDGRR